MDLHDLKKKSLETFSRLVILPSWSFAHLGYAAMFSLVMKMPSYSVIPCFVPGIQKHSFELAVCLAYSSPKWAWN